MTGIPAGTHAFGPADGELRVNVFREGAAARMGHDLVFGVRNWSAKVTVDPLMGALKVRDAVDIILDVPFPVGE